jgi:hypothetical protein
MTSENETPTETPMIDAIDIMAFMEKDKAERDARNAKDRAVLHALLQSKGVTRIDAQYDAYGDSGNVKDITFTPVTVMIETAQEEALRDFIWSMAYALHPGFENNDGGDGEVVWEIDEDKIQIEHRERFTDYNLYTHEDL